MRGRSVGKLESLSSDWESESNSGALEKGPTAGQRGLWPRARRSNPGRALSEAAEEPASGRWRRPVGFSFGGT